MGRNVATLTDGHLRIDNFQSPWRRHSFYGLVFYVTGKGTLGYTADLLRRHLLTSRSKIAEGTVAFPAIGERAIREERQFK